MGGEGVKWERWEEVVVRGDGVGGGRMGGKRWVRGDEVGSGRWGGRSWGQREVTDL